MFAILPRTNQGVTPGSFFAKGTAISTGMLTVYTCSPRKLTPPFDMSIHRTTSSPNSFVRTHAKQFTFARTRLRRSGLAGAAADAASLLFVSAAAMLVFDSLETADCRCVVSVL